MPQVGLLEESRFFQEHVADWFKDKRRAGKWALIKKRELVGTFDSFNEAVAAGFRKFGLEPFFVSEIDPEANKLTTTSLMLDEFLCDCQDG